MVSKALNVPATPSPERRWKGVRKRSWGRYVCEIRLPRSRQRVWLGSYATAQEAACAYDAASLCLRGTAASLNFPSFMPSSSVLLRDSPSSELPSYSREELQLIAATAAAWCRNAEKELPTSSDTNSAQRSPAQQSSRATLSALYTLNQRQEISHQAVTSQLQTIPQADSDQAEHGKEKASSAPLQQCWTSSDETQVPSSATEEEQCVFSILKELGPLPQISNAFGTPTCY